MKRPLFIKDISYSLLYGGEDSLYGKNWIELIKSFGEIKDENIFDEKLFILFYSKEIFFRKTHLWLADPKLNYLSFHDKLIEIEIDQIKNIICYTKPTFDTYSDFIDYFKNKHPEFFQWYLFSDYLNLSLNRGP